MAVAVGCGQYDELDLAPDDYYSAAIATHTLDVTLASNDGREFPARIYFNKAATETADRLARQATVLTESPFDDDKAAAVVPAFGQEQQQLTDEPWVYIRIGTSEDGTRGVGWNAPLTALLSRAPIPELSIPSGQDAETAPAPTYTAQYHLNFNYSMDPGSSTIYSDVINCTKGATAMQNTHWALGGGRGDFNMRMNGVYQASPDVVFEGYSQYTEVSTGSLSESNPRNMQIKVDRLSGYLNAAAGINCL